MFACINICGYLHVDMCESKEGFLKFTSKMSYCRFFYYLASNSVDLSAHFFQTYTNKSSVVAQIISINASNVCSQRKRERRASTRIVRTSPRPESATETLSELYLSHVIAPAKRKKYANLATVSFPELVATDGEHIAEIKI